MGKPKSVKNTDHRGERPVATPGYDGAEVTLPASDRFALENLALKRENLAQATARLNAEQELLALQERVFVAEVTDRLGLHGRWRVDLKKGVAHRMESEATDAAVNVETLPTKTPAGDVQCP